MHYLEVPSPQTITLVTTGGVLLILIDIQEAYKKTSYYSYMPLQDTHNVDDTYCLLPCSFLFSMLCPFFTGSHYLPLYFQALGSIVTGVGIR